MYTIDKQFGAFVAGLRIRSVVAIAAAPARYLLLERRIYGELYLLAPFLGGLLAPFYTAGRRWM
ncbi:MAG: hypothetical protein SPH82_03295 [Eubacteriales bacterium]|nr:hypothetical protein [Eubacteriales bacterium]